MRANRPSNIEQQALQRFVRARAPDFSAEERQDLDAWMADDDHRAEYIRLQGTWTALDGLAGEIGNLRNRPKPFVSRLARPLGALAATGAVVALFLAVRPEAIPQRFETAAAEHRVLTLADGTTIALNAESAIDLLDGKAPRVDLLRGDVFIDVSSHDTDKLEVRVAGATIHDIGTRFSVVSTGSAASVAVAEGMVELRTGKNMQVVHAGRAARFDADGAVQEQAVRPEEIAPWREQRWRFEATPLLSLAAELARQQRIQVDIADPAIGALTISGSFGFDEPERVLWAAAQVHELKLKRMGQRHYSLQRTN
jgi:transmembrane sensor